MKVFALVAAVLMVGFLAPCASAEVRLTVLATFDQSNGGYPHGAQPVGTLAEGTDGSFYGVTSQGGENGFGTVFKVTTGGALTTLHSFTGGNDGGYPAAGLALGTDGDFYGTTSQGGSGYGGTIFKITASGSITTLVSLNLDEPSPLNPQAEMIRGGDNNLYGTTETGGQPIFQSEGTVFKLTPDGVLTILHSFPILTADNARPDGARPYAGLLRGTDGAFYGTTSVGGSAVEDQLVTGYGTVFRATADGVFTTLHSFTGGVDSGSGNEGASPMGPLALGSNGNFYGTTSAGGSYLNAYDFGCGTVFTMTPDGTLTTLYAFTGGDDGMNPYAGLVLGPDGNFYGTTTMGGPGAIGTIFRVTPAGALTTLFWAGDSSGCGAWPNQLVKGSDGNLYGTTQANPDSEGGTFFCISGFPGQAGLSREVNWVEVDQFQMRLPASVGNDSFVLQGSCNIWLSTDEPWTITLSIDGWSLVMDAASWKRQGKGNVYTYNQGGVVGKMTYWANGTTKCLLRLSASKQTLQGHLPNFPNVPIRLQVGGFFDESSVAAMTLKNHLAKTTSVGPLPIFCVRKLTVARDLKKANRDLLAFAGKVFFADDFNPALDTVTMNIGPYAVSLPAGTLPPAKNGVIKYMAPTGSDGKLAVAIDTNRHTLTVIATRLDLSSLTAATHVSLSVTNHVGADWDYGLFLATNKRGTVCSY